MLFGGQPNFVCGIVRDYTYRWFVCAGYRSATIFREQRVFSVLFPDAGSAAVAVGCWLACLTALILYTT